ncbi:MAG: hypothetical protein ABWY48_09655, partial [Pseudoxanthomonas sp.]
AQRDKLLQAHATFLAEGLSCTLDRRPRLVAENTAITAARDAVRASLRTQELVFDTGGQSQPQANPL